MRIQATERPLEPAGAAKAGRRDIATHVERLALVSLLIACAVSCSVVARQGRSPMYLVIERLEASRGGSSGGEFAGTLLSDVVTLITTPAPCSETSPCPTVFNDGGRVTLRLVPKDVGNVEVPTVPTSNNEVTITRYRVVYRRGDGRNIPGVDVPYPFDGAVTGTVPSSGTTIDLAFEIVRHIAKQEAPLVLLKNSTTIIATIAELTFYGQDRVGNDVSATGSMLIEFGNFHD